MTMQLLQGKWENECGEFPVIFM